MMSGQNKVNIDILMQIMIRMKMDTESHPPLKILIMIVTLL